MEKQDPRKKYLESLDPSKFRVLDYPGGIFLCGGKTDPLHKPPRSWRDAFERYLQVNPQALSRQLQSAEEIVKSSLNGPYKDLFELERHIASISAAIVVIVESPGSFAELGAFSQIDEICERLLVVIHNPFYHEPDPGFIRLGPIEFLETNYPGTVSVQTEPDLKAKRYDPTKDINLSEMAKAIEDRILTLHHERKFTGDDPGHKMLLVAQLCYHMHSLSFEEIITSFDTLTIPIDKAELQKFLYLLRVIRLLASYTRSGKIFYKCEETRLVSLTQKRGSRIIDTTRARVEFAQYYKETNDRRLLR